MFLYIGLCKFDCCQMTSDEFNDTLSVANNDCTIKCYGFAFGRFIFLSLYSLMFSVFAILVLAHISETITLVLSLPIFVTIYLGMAWRIYVRTSIYISNSISFYTCVHLKF